MPSVDTILEILGNDSRRRILSLLAKKPCYVSEISYALKMAPKAVIEHLEKLEKAGLIRSFEDGRRRYYYINQNMRLEISISPHIFQTNLVNNVREMERKMDKLMDEVFRIRDEISGISTRFMEDTITNIYRTLRNVEEIQRKFSMIQGYLASRASEIFERFLDELDKCVEDDYEKMVLLALSKGAKRVSEISEEFGIPYSEVEKAIERLKRKGVVEEKKGRRGLEIIIKC
ncbi:MAG: metalloregulator ArsR/SmtB family transcription factor [Archaeoglobus sp.]|nr:metalloregulator ArsR/SmtB family transcription factor [Archaeoglobus sp.]